MSNQAVGTGTGRGAKQAWVNMCQLRLGCRGRAPALDRDQGASTPASASAPSPLGACPGAAPVVAGGGVMAMFGASPGAPSPGSAPSAPLPAAAIAGGVVFPGPGWAVVGPPLGVVVGVEAVSSAASAAVRGAIAPGFAGKRLLPPTGGSRSGLMQPVRQSATVHASERSMPAVLFMNVRSMLTLASLMFRGGGLSAGRACAAAPRTCRQSPGRKTRGVDLAMRFPCQESGRWVGPGQAEPPITRCAQTSR